MTKRPQNHKVRCACPICKNIRRKERLEAHSLKDLYEARRNGRLSIWGTVLGAYSAFWEWLLIRLLWKKVGGEIIKSYAIVNLYKVHITDGYALVFLSPFILMWWAFVTALLAGLTSIIITLLGVFVLIMYILSILYIPLAIYTLFFELPASIINRDFDDRSRKHKASRDEQFKKHHSSIAWATWMHVIILAGILVTIFVGWGWGLVAFISLSFVSFMI